jgi:gluconate kinase
MSEKNTTEPMIIWLTGNSGAGKTFTGDYLGTIQNFVHIDGDVVVEKSKNEEKKKNFSDCVKAFDFWFEEKEAPKELWHPHFECLIKEAKEKTNNGKNVVVSFTVYHRQVRDFLREKLPKLLFIHLICSKKELIRRAKVRFEQYVLSKDSSIEELFKKHYNMEYSDENFEKVTIHIMRGMMDLEKDEIETGYYHTVNVDDGVTYFKKLHEILKLPFSENEKIPFEKIANINYERFKNLN